MLKYKYIFKIKKIYGSSFIEQHSETVIFGMKVDQSYSVL